MEIMNTVIVHLFIGAILTFLGNFVLSFCASVGFRGECANKVYK